MFQANIVNSLLKGLDPIHQKSISLTPGQIFNGKVLKLFPGQFASLQLGGLNVTAKLEAALTAGNRYWFQVQPGDGIPQLKVLEGFGENGKGQPRDGENVARQLGISHTKTTDMVVNFLASKEIPFSKSHIASGAETLQKVGMANEKGLSILQIMMERNLPITPTTFMAVKAVIEGKGFSTEIQELSQMLETVKGKEPILQQLQQSLQAILKDAIVKIDQHQIVDLIKNFLSEEFNSSKSLQAQTELQKLGIFKNEETPQQIMTNLKEMIVNATDKSLKMVWPTLSKEEILSQLNKGQLPELLSKVVISKGEQGERSLQQLLLLMTKENVVQKLPSASFDAPMKLASLVKQIGYQYERDVFQFLQFKEENNEKVFLELKSLLMKAQELPLSSNIQEKVDSTLQRITGQQLFTVNQEGPLSHHSVMVPLKLLGFQTDLTIQWEGKKNNNGELNPNHCRILFYINLEQLKETIIDVQIQNRIVSLHVINQFEKPNKLIKDLQPLLKQALFELNYQLSSVKWTQPSQTDLNTPKSKTQAQNSYLQSQRPYQGVDVRI